MKHRIAAAGLLSLAATGAMAGGVDRSGQLIGGIFEPGNYIEFSFRSVTPDVGGTQINPLPGSPAGSSSGDLARSFGYAGMTLKFALNDKFEAAVIYDQPYGAAVSYPAATTYFARGSTASLRANAWTTVARYRFTDRISAYAGLRMQDFNAEAVIPFIGAPVGYTGTASKDTGFGYLVGAAYERPEIALRVALTYFSRISHSLDTTESSPLGAGRRSTMQVETPQAVNLDFQTGVAPGTLVFGSVRWVDWSEFSIPPADYVALTGAPLVSFADDTITYSLGVGRQLTENWAVALTAVHEPSTGGFRSNLNPTDGRSALGLGVTYTQDKFKLRAGVQHIWLGDARTQVLGIPAGDFTGNTAIGVGFSAGFSF